MVSAIGTHELQHEIEQFLYDEATLLDEGHFWKWLDLFGEDVRYWMPVRETLMDSRDGLHPENAIALSILDDDKQFLRLRVERLDTGLAHAETPPSRTRHLVTNVRIRDIQDDELTVYSNFVVYQSRLERTDYEFVGRREDRLRRSDGQWKIVRRKIVLDHGVLPRALSTFF